MANQVIRPGAVLIVTAAVAAAIAVYESPQARQLAYELRRRVALALHTLGDEFSSTPPQHDENLGQQPRFNRPEDAEGFRRSSAQPQHGVDADDESKRRQREELMYWNALHLEKQRQEQRGGLNMQTEPEQNLGPMSSRNRGSSFDDFLQEDPNAEEKGAFIYHSGTDAPPDRRGLTYRGGIDRTQSLTSDIASPKSKTHRRLSGHSYTASNHQPTEKRENEPPTIAETRERLIDTSDHATIADPPIVLPSLQDLRSTHQPSTTSSQDIFASIHAWADTASRTHQSPADLHAMSVLSVDEVDDPPVSVPGSGEATPTDTMSLVGSAAEVWQSARSGATSDADIISIDGGISTPGTWTEVGSDISEHGFVL